MSACITIVPTSSFAKNDEKLSHFSAHFFKTFSNSYICFSLITLFYVRTVKRNSCRVDSFPTNISSCRNGSHTDLHTSSIQIYFITLKMELAFSALLILLRSNISPDSYCPILGEFEYFGNTSKFLILLNYFCVIG